METPEWLREVRDEFEGNGAWVSTLNILDNEEEEFDCETDADVAAHVLLNLAELADESQSLRVRGRKRRAQSVVARALRRERVGEDGRAQDPQRGPRKSPEAPREGRGQTAERHRAEQDRERRFAHPVSRRNGSIGPGILRLRRRYAQGFDADSRSRFDRNSLTSPAGSCTTSRDAIDRLHESEGRRR